MVVVLATDVVVGATVVVTAAVLVRLALAVVAFRPREDEDPGTPRPTRTTTARSATAAPPNRPGWPSFLATAAVYSH